MSKPARTEPGLSGKTCRYCGKKIGGHNEDAQWVYPWGVMLDEDRIPWCGCGMQGKFTRGDGRVIHFDPVVFCVDCNTPMPLTDCYSIEGHDAHWCERCHSEELLS